LHKGFNWLKITTYLRGLKYLRSYLISTKIGFTILGKNPNRVLGVTSKFLTQESTFLEHGIKTISNSCGLINTRVSGTIINCRECPLQESREINSRKGKR
jgi:hypothetical protein